jgi:dsDNA-specific endonuclease/ATPase MutS2
MSADLFFSRLLQDDIFTMGEGRVVAAFKQAAPVLIQGRTLDASASESYLLAA